MKILLVEDDEIKRGQLDRFVHDQYPTMEVQLAKSFNSALKAIATAEHDIILLDMTMPTYDINSEELGGRPQHYAGRDLMRQLDRRKIEIPVIVVTGFDVFGEGPSALTRSQLDAELRKEHSSIYRGTIFYNAATDGWKTDLRTALDLVLGKNK